MWNDQYNRPKVSVEVLPLESDGIGEDGEFEPTAVEVIVPTAQYLFLFIKECEPLSYDGTVGIYHEQLHQLLGGKDPLESGEGGGRWIGGVFRDEVGQILRILPLVGKCFGENVFGYEFDGMHEGNSCSRIDG